MFSAVMELAKKLADITADRDSEIQARMNWMKRAIEVESRTVSVSVELQSLCSVSVITNEKCRKRSNSCCFWSTVTRHFASQN
jgi:hypothetical protein